MIDVLSSTVIRLLKALGTTSFIYLVCSPAAASALGSQASTPYTVASQLSEKHDKREDLELMRRVDDYYGQVRGNAYHLASRKDYRGAIITINNGVKQLKKYQWAGGYIDQLDKDAEDFLSQAVREEFIPIIQSGGTAKFRHTFVEYQKLVMYGIHRHLKSLIASSEDALEDEDIEIGRVLLLEGRVIWRDPSGTLVLAQNGSQFFIEANEYNDLITFKGWTLFGVIYTGKYEGTHAGMLTLPLDPVSDSFRTF